MPTEGLTETEEKKVIRILRKVGSRMTAEFYNAIAAKFCLTAIETVVLRRHGGAIQVLLTRRAVNDPHWASLYHSPGSMVRASDNSFEDAFGRVQNGELGTKFLSPPVCAETFIHNHARGKEIAVVFVCEIADEPPGAKFFDINELPPDIIPQHHRVIMAAVKKFIELGR